MEITLHEQLKTLRRDSRHTSPLVNRLTDEVMSCSKTETANNCGILLELMKKEPFPAYQDSGAFRQIREKLVPYAVF